MFTGLVLPPALHNHVAVRGVTWGASIGNQPAITPFAQQVFSESTGVNGVEAGLS